VSILVAVVMSSAVAFAGETFRVTSDIGSQTFVGTGIHGAKGDNWQGVWTYTGVQDISVEVWTRQQAR
jgi:hypothetical protein